jgi:hypothetical protein
MIDPPSGAAEVHRLDWRTRRYRIVADSAVF